MFNKPNLTKNTWPVSSINSFNNGLLFGHKSLKLSKQKYWHPFATNYLLGIRNNIAIINSEFTKKCLLQAFFVIALILKKKGHLLIINTNHEYFNLNKNLNLLTFGNNKTKFPNFPQLSNTISYCYYKWIGGTLTNWKQVSKSVLTYAKFSERCEKFLMNNAMEFPKYKKVKSCFQGLIKKQNGKSFLGFNEKPDLIFLMNPNENKNIISEANKLQIPVIAFIESNTNTKGISYPIPVNTYSIHFMYYCFKKIFKLSNNFFKY